MNTRRASVKITLWRERVYVLELWIMDHITGVDVVLDTDFMIPAGVRLDLSQANAKRPDENQWQFQAENDVSSSYDGIDHQRHELWIRRAEKLFPSVTKFHQDRPTRVRLTNLTDRLVLCPTHLAFVAWVPIGTLPKQVGYVRLDSKKYSEWQVLAYEAVRDKTLFRRERELYEGWLAAQPPAVDRPSYTRPKLILRRHLDNSDSASGGTIANEEVEDSSANEDLAGSHGIHEGIVSVAISSPPTSGAIETAPPRDATSVARGAVCEGVA
ncbi:unnamed protein product [Phytophthora fragariaefolia]|uniref:Unnamed protein product n=1 Tax=Phytophthora fragariaefolia TaxID=1490495 RepID=A0A9W6XL10_9STRA|nr:unnamed protein product [Phytophthora fragariaefolia]